jgi:ribosomal protein L9
MPAKTQREREAAQRKEKLERIQEQVEDGSLVIRKMTDEDRARFGSGADTERAAKPAPRRKRRRLPTRPLPPAPRSA